MIRRAAVLALGLSLSLSLAPGARAADPAAPAPTFALGDSLRFDPAVRAGVLPNGLRYLIRHNAKPEARVALRLAVAAGSTAEADDQQGFAHFAEHMNFNGSTHFKPEEMVAYLQSIGLRFGSDANAYTEFDETVYMLEAPTDRDTLLDRGLLALADFAGGATLSDAEIEKERGVVLEEWRTGRGAGERIQRVTLPAIFHGSRYAERLPIGKPEIIEKGPAERLRAFYRDWYTPDQMAVIAVGDIDPARMEALIHDHFGGLPRPVAPRAPTVYDVPPHAETLVAIATDREATGSSVMMLFKRAYRLDRTVGDYRRGLVESLYRTMFNLRFNEIAHRADAPFLNAGAGTQRLGRLREAWQLRAGVRDGGIQQGLAALLEEAARVRQHGFLAGELARAKDQMRARNERFYAERDKSESDGFAAEYVRCALEGEASPGIEMEYLLTRTLLDGITLDEVNALTPGVMREDSRVVLAIAPEKAGVAVPTEADLRAVLARAGAAAVPAWEDKATGRALMERLPRPGRVKSRRVVEELGATVLTLSNGVEVWLKPTDFKADEILFAASALGGLSLADSAAYFTASLTPQVVADAGVGGFTGVELQKVLAGRIARANASYGPYTQGINGSARPADLESALQLVHLTFTRPTRDPAAFAALQQRLRSALADRANSPEAAFSDTLNAVNSGYFYMNRVPTTDAVDAVALDAVLAFHRARFANAADFTFAFAGNFQVDSIAPLLARYLGSLPSKGKRTSSFAARGPRYPTAIRTVRVLKGVEPKSSTRITFFTTGQPFEELEQHRARACATILGDHLRQSLRELLGGTYSPSSGFGTLQPLPGYATAGASFGSDPARVDTLVAVTLAEVRGLRESGPSVADVQKEQEIERRELEVALRTNGFWTGAILTALQLGIDPRRIAKRRERIDGLTPENLRETFRKYFPLDRYSVITLLPEPVAK